MASDKIKYKSTSRSTATMSDIVLRETNSTQLVFRPTLVENPKQSEAAVNGSFVHRRKGSKQSWEDVAAQPLSGIKAGEGYRINLHAGELHHLVEELNGLYELHSKHGVPQGIGEYAKVDSNFARIIELPRHQLREFLKANSAIGGQLLSKLLAWSIDTNEPAELIARLVGLGSESLKKLNVAVSVNALQIALNAWSNETSNSDEKYWQQQLSDNSFVLERVFSWPATIIQERAYVGGKGITNRGGGILDFLLRNGISRNAALVEIKTPSTSILSGTYRNGIHNISPDLSGAVLQVLNYKHNLYEDYKLKVGNQGNLFETFDPSCVVVIGNASAELTDNEKIKSFELFRNQLTNVTVITYDELFDKLKHLIDLLEGDGAGDAEEFGSEGDTGSEYDYSFEPDDELPF